MASDNLIEITQENFDRVIQENDIVLLDFWADWCEPCKAFKPIYEQCAERFSDVVFGMIDTDAQSELASEFQIRSIPTLLLIRDGVVVYSDSGTLPASAVEDLILQAKGLDMGVVKAGGGVEE